MTVILPVVMGLLLVPIWTLKVVAGFFGLIQMMADFESQQRGVVHPTSLR